MATKKRSTIQKFSRLIKGTRRYYFRKIASNGETLFCSPGYMSRSGRNRAVNKIAETETVKIENV